jgi:LuxR family transcriptional regulator, maltose regulon positive regulatory protein
MSSQTAPTDRPGLRVIEPKLMVPRIQPGMLRRDGLLQMIDGDHGAALVVVNSPVGYGKTTLLRSWCIERHEPVIWLTLDAADDDPVRLWSHLVTGVERLGVGLGRRALMSLSAAGTPIQTIVDEVMNALVAYGRPLAIVLDDLHAVTSQASLASLEHAVKRLPANARVLAATRSDPEIGLARLRARGRVTEIRARELAFTIDETR